MERAGYAEIQHILQGLVDRFGWHPITEAGAWGWFRAIGIELQQGFVTRGNVRMLLQGEIGGASIREDSATTWGCSRSTTHRHCAVRGSLAAISNIPAALGNRHELTGCQPIAGRPQIRTVHLSHAVLQVSVQDLKTVCAPNLRLHLPQARLLAASWTGRARCWSRAANWNSDTCDRPGPCSEFCVSACGRDHCLRAGWAERDARAGRQVRAVSFGLDKPCNACHHSCFRRRTCGSAAGKIIGCELDGQSVTLEPGGQFELSGAPVSTLHQTCAEVNQHLYQVWRLLERALCSGAPGGFRAV